MEAKISVLVKILAFVFVSVSNVRFSSTSAVKVALVTVAMVTAGVRQRYCRQAREHITSCAGTPRATRHRALGGPVDYDPLHNHRRRKAFMERLLRTGFENIDTAQHVKR